MMAAWIRVGGLRGRLKVGVSLLLSYLDGTFIVC